MKKTAKTIEVCRMCDGMGYVVTEHGATPCECQRDLEFAARCRIARIPKKFLGKSLKSFETGKRERKIIQDEARHFIKAFTSRSRSETCKGLLLTGKEGTGKTHIAIAVLKEVMTEGYSGLYWNVPELFLELRRVMSGEANHTEGDLFDEARRADLLVLDDLGAEKSSEYVTDRLYVLVNGRYQEDKVTVITSNQSIDELRGQLGARIASRLCEMCTVVRFPDGDFRREKLQ